MFKVTKERTFTHDVTVMTPVDGGHRAEKFKATFNYLGIDETSKFDLHTPDGTTGFLKAIIRRLDDLTDDDDRPLPYSDELRDAVLQMANVRQAVTATYLAAINKDPKSGN